MATKMLQKIPTLKCLFYIQKSSLSFNIPSIQPPLGTAYINCGLSLGTGCACSVINCSLQLRLIVFGIASNYYPSCLCASLPFNCIPIASLPIALYSLRAFVPCCLCAFSVFTLCLCAFLIVFLLPLCLLPPCLVFHA